MKGEIIMNNKIKGTIIICICLILFVTFAWLGSNVVIIRVPGMNDVVELFNK